MASPQPDLFAPMAEEPRAGRPHTRDGSGIRRRLGSGWRQADAARPPGGARVQLGCCSRPRLPAWPRPQSAVGAEPHRCWDSLRGSPAPARWSRRYPESQGVASESGTRRPAGTAGVWPGRGDAECTRRGLRQSQSCPRTLGDRCAPRAEAAARALDRSCRLLPLPSENRAHCRGHDPHIRVPSNLTDRRVCRRLSISYLSGHCWRRLCGPTVTAASYCLEAAQCLRVKEFALPSGSTLFLWEPCGVSGHQDLQRAWASQTVAAFSPEAHSWHCQLIRVYTSVSLRDSVCACGWVRVRVRAGPSQASGK